MNRIWHLRSTLTRRKYLALIQLRVGCLPANSLNEHVLKYHTVGWVCKTIPEYPRHFVHPQSYHSTRSAYTLVFDQQNSLCHNSHRRYSIVEQGGWRRVAPAGPSGRKISKPASGLKGNRVFDHDALALQIVLLFDLPMPKSLRRMIVPGLSVHASLKQRYDLS